MYCTILFVFHSYDDFRSSVVSSDDIGGHHERLVSSSSQTKVQDLHVHCNNSVSVYAMHIHSHTNIHVHAQTQYRDK